MKGIEGVVTRYLSFLSIRDEEEKQKSEFILTKEPVDDLHRNKPLTSSVKRGVRVGMMTK